MTSGAFGKTWTYDAFLALTLPQLLNELHQGRPPRTGGGGEFMDLDVWLKKYG